MIVKKWLKNTFYPKIEIDSSQFLGTRVMSRTWSADKTTQLNHSYSLKCEFTLSSTWGIVQSLHSDSLLMTGRMKVRGTNPAKDPRFTREKSAQHSQERKTQVATKVLLIVDLRSKTMKKCNKERKIWNFVVESHSVSVKKWLKIRSSQKSKLTSVNF